MDGPVFDAEREYWEARFVIDRNALDLSEPWAARFPADVYCDVVAVDGEAADYVTEPSTPWEVSNWEATEPDYRDYTLGTAYSHCVENGTTWTTSEWPVHPNQVAEVLEAFEFCPDHPDRAAIEERIAALGIEQGEIDAGRRFGGGLHRVGEDIQPGSYYSESDDGFENCYWERQDSAGNIIENYFSGHVFRVEVTITETDYAFYTDGCGQWEPLQ